MKWILFLLGFVLLIGTASASEWELNSTNMYWENNISFDNTTVTYDTIELFNGWNPANKWWGTSGGTMNKLDSANEKISIRFTSPTTKNVSSVGVVSYTPLNSPVYRIGLQTDDGTGNPDGSYIDGQYNTIQPTSSNDFYFGTFGSEITITKDTIYHLVIEYDSGTIGASNYCYFKAMKNFWNYAVGYTGYNYGGYDMDVGYNDTQYFALFYTGAAWQNVVNARYSPNFALNFSDGTHYGQVTLHNYKGILGNTWCGQRVPIHNQNKTVTHISTYWWMEAGVPADDCYYEIHNSTHSILRSGTFLAKEDLEGSGRWYEKELASPITLEVGEVYYLIWNSPGSNASGYYNHDGSGPIYFGDWAGNISYGGMDSYHVKSLNSGSSWSDYTKNDYSFGFKLQEVFTGNVTSVVKDSETIDVVGSKFNSISINTTLPAGTNVSVYANTSSDNITFSGYNLIQSNIVSDTNYSITNSRYVKWRLELKTNDSTVTPEIDSATVYISSWSEDTNSTYDGQTCTYYTDGSRSCTTPSESDKVVFTNSIMPVVS